LEEATLSETIRDISRKIDGVDTVEILVIDDGSSDRTVVVARENGVEHIVSHTANKGLARTNPHFSLRKKGLQIFGSTVVRRMSRISVPDAVSGFRAISREAALQLNIVSSFSYTIEMLDQAGSKHLSVTSVSVATNPKTRESRLFRSIPQFLSRSGTTIVRMYAMQDGVRRAFSALTDVGYICRSIERSTKRGADIINGPQARDSTYHVLARPA